MRHLFFLLILAPGSPLLTAQVIPDWTRDGVFESYDYSDFAYHQTYLVAARRCGGIDVLDVRNTNAAPTLIGRLDSAPALTEMRVLDGVLYALADRSVYVVDIAEPTQPSLELLLQVPTNNTLLDIHKQGDQFFVGNTDTFNSSNVELFVFDLVGLNAIPITFSGTQGAHSAPKLVFYNDLILITDYQRLYVYRFDGGNQATLVTEQTPSNGVFNLAVFGDALLVQSRGEIVTHDLTQPETLPELGRTFNQFELGEWVRQGDFLLINTQRFPSVWSFADPANPQFVQSTGVLGHEDSYLDSDRGLFVALQPTFVEYGAFNGSWNPDRFFFADAFLTARGAALNGDLLAVNVLGEIGLFSLETPSQPRFLNRFPVSLFINRMFWFNDYLVLASVGSEIPTLWIYDLRDPAQPRLAFSTGLGGYTMTGSLLWLDTFFDISLLDMSDPDNPVTLGRLDREVPAQVAGERAVVNQDAVLVFEPTGRTLYRVEGDALVASSNATDVLPAGMLIRRGDVLFVHGETTLLAYDISDLTALVELGRLTDLPEQVVLHDANTFFGDFLALRTREGTAWIDVSNPADLKQVRLVENEELEALSGETAIFDFGCNGLFEVRSLATCAPPVITEQPVGAYVCDTEPYALSVTATGPDLSYQWYRDGFALLAGTNATLNLTAPGDGGVYTCVVANDCQEIQTEPATVLPTICELSRAYQTWRTDGAFCGVQNPTVLAFAASVNAGGGCP